MRLSHASWKVGSRLKLLGYVLADSLCAGEVCRAQASLRLIGALAICGIMWDNAEVCKGIV
jgi:hypothetical protein